MWQTGDLALCVKSGRKTRVGCVYTVHDVSLPGQVKAGARNCGSVPNLRFVEVIPTTQRHWSGSQRFIKVTPLEADEFDREVIELMNGQPVPVEV